MTPLKTPGNDGAGLGCTIPRHLCQQTTNPTTLIIKMRERGSGARQKLDGCTASVAAFATPRTSCLMIHSKVRRPKP